MLHPPGHDDKPYNHLIHATFNWKINNNDILSDNKAYRRQLKQTEKIK